MRKLPSGKEICEQQLIEYVNKIKNVKINLDEISEVITLNKQEF